MMAREKAFSSGGRWAHRLALLAGDACAVAIGWVSIDALAYLRLRVPELIALIAIWLVASTIGELICSGWPRLKWLGLSVAGPLPVIAAEWISEGFRYPLSLGALTGTMIWLGVLRLVWRTWIREYQSPIWSETLRRWFLVGAALWPVLPLFTDRLVGGVDARWYANMLTDFIQQSRRGIFPVFLGQGEFAYNGAAHLFRSAPLFLWVAGIWDVLTFQSLPVISLQHLSAITAALGMAFGLYHGLTRLAPERRWLAAMVAALCVMSPAVLAPMYCADMYMTFMTLATLPLVFCGNAGVLRSADSGSWKLLSAGLALTWMSHPPTGLLATLLSLAIQVMGWSVASKPFVTFLSEAVRGGIWFVGLSAYYFRSMSELPPRPQGSMVPDILAVLGVATTWIAIVRGVWRGERRWLAATVPAVLLLAAGSPVWLVWASSFAVLSWLYTFFHKRDRSAGGAGMLAEAFVLAGVALAAGWPLAGKFGFVPDGATLAGLKNYSQGAGKALRPLTEGVGTIWDFQPGYAVCVMMLLGLAAGLRQRVSAVLLTMAVSVAFVLLFRIPGVSDFLVGFVPIRLGSIMSIPLPHRLFPAIAAGAAVAAFLALAEGEMPRLRWGVHVVLAALLVWSAWQAGFFVRRGLFATLNRALTERNFMPENVVLERFAYDLLPIPKYFGNGVSDPRLENRLLDDRLKLVFGPDDLARLMEAHESERLEFTSTQDDSAADWVKLGGKVHLMPGQTRLLRFEWEPKINYTGYLIGRSPFGDYREYELPSSGLPGAFGTATESTKVLPLRNTWHYALEYTWSHYRKPGHTIEGDGRHYAWITASTYRPELAPIRIDSFVPYRARVKAVVPGFLETPRVYLPGYKAWVDGKPAAAQESQQRLVMIPIGSGEHSVELRFVGTLRLWAALGVSAVAWLLLLQPMKLYRRLRYGIS
jgi:hypothetical protein